jgi:hypothetical protein
MACPAKKGLNLRICGYGMPGQAFNGIHVPEDEHDKLPKTFPGLLTIKEGVATKCAIDIESTSRPPSGFWCLNDKTIKELMTFAKCEVGKMSYKLH